MPIGGNLLDCRSWLQQRCVQEQCRLEDLLADDTHREEVLESDGSSECRERQCSHNASGSGSIPPDTAILQRIREGRGPRDQSSEDLLAPLRDVPIQGHGTEPYGDMVGVLLEWNVRVSERTEEDRGVTASLKIAIERRAHLLKAPACGSDKSSFLEESSAELLQALTILRPEFAGFKDQELLNVLLVMWANIRIAIPDLDDELKMLTMTALINEVESKSHASNAVKLSSIARSLSVARLQLDPAEVEGLEKKMQAFKIKLRETAVEKVIDKIKTGRRGLTVAKLVELQKLTELQAVQKWATHAALGGQHGQIQNRACNQADGRLQRVLQHQAPELDAHIQAVQSNAHALAGMSADLLERAARSGFAVEDRTSPASLEPASIDIKTNVTGGITDIANAREQAGKLLEHMDAVGSRLDVMLAAAKNIFGV